jgi:cytochrome P450
MEMQLILAMALQRFRLRLVPDHPIALNPEATLRPKYGMKMTVETV